MRGHAGQEFTFALFCPVEATVAYVREILTLQGFVTAPITDHGQELLNEGGQPRVPQPGKKLLGLQTAEAGEPQPRNIETTIKAPLRANPRVLAAVSAAHRRLQRALTEMYP